MSKEAHQPVEKKDHARQTNRPNIPTTYVPEIHKGMNPLYVPAATISEACLLQ
jgi:hypothetical protein